MGNAKLKEKQKWSNEKLHLDNARKLRGIKFIDPEDKEFRGTIKNACKKLETPVVPAMPCKIMKKNCGSGESNKSKTKLACDESTRMRLGNSIPNHHEDRIAGKETINYSITILSQIDWFLCFKLWKIHEANAAVDKEWEKLENFGVERDESQK